MDVDSVPTGALNGEEASCEYLRGCLRWLEATVGSRPTCSSFTVGNLNSSGADKVADVVILDIYMLRPLVVLWVFNKG